MIMETTKELDDILAAVGIVRAAKKACDEAIEGLRRHGKDYTALEQRMQAAERAYRSAMQHLEGLVVGEQK